MRYTDRDHILNTASQKLLNQIEHQKDIFILSNSTVDGLVGSAILLSLPFIIQTEIQQLDALIH